MNKKQSNSDQRQYLRYDSLDYAMSYSKQFPQGLRCVIADVSLGGLSLRHKDALPSGEEVELRLGHGTREPICLKGIVRHCVLVPDSGLHASGVQFFPKTHDERLAVARYVNNAFQRQCDHSA